jgi:anti-sigma regulatory factor (Ser/Thr protein kinase)
MTRISATHRAATHVGARHPLRAWAWAREHLPSQPRRGQHQEGQHRGGQQASTHSFTAEPQQVRAARRFLLDLLGGSSVAHDAVLCLSEVATNSVLHSNSHETGGRFSVQARLSRDGGVRVEVEDQGGPWSVRAKSDGQPLRGLAMVDQLADEWGISGDGSTGRTVWFEMAPYPVIE